MVRQKRRSPFSRPVASSYCLMMADLGCIALFRNVDDLRVFRVLGPRAGHCQHHDDYGAYRIVRIFFFAFSLMSSLPASVSISQPGPLVR